MITPTATMQLIVEIETNEQGDITEAAVDFFRAFDADPVGINEIFLEDATLNISPNPTSGEFSINYDLKNTESTVQLTVIDVFGKTVFTEKTDNTIGKIVVKENLPNGVYFVQIQAGNEISRGVKLIVN
ncbi:MAG: hypothetical protein ACI9LN_003629 [Saprospiraceae bacterium]